MTQKRMASMRRKAGGFFIIAAIFIIGMAGAATAHPLGNFTVNHFTRITISAQRIGLRHVIDMAEIPAFQESRLIDTDGDGSLSSSELDAYAEKMAAQYGDELLLTVDDARVALTPISRNAKLLEGEAGLAILRIECDFAGDVSATGASAARRLRFEDTSYRNRIGWREIVIAPAGGVAVYDSSAFGNSLSDELKAYPQDSLAAPLGEREAEMSFTTGDVPAGATGLLTREGQPASKSTDSFAALIAAPELTVPIALLGLLIASGLGALHALSPGHGKTVVGAYLVGSRGTAKHAAFLGLTVTVTHTIGVLALGLVTLFASRYVVPEKLFPMLSFISGAIVLALGLSLFIKRLKTALGLSPRDHAHHDHAHHDHAHHLHAHNRDDAHTHLRDHSRHDDAGGKPITHSHGGRAHTHLPLGADGARVTWRSLLALGISGGLLPCPSALVVLLSAISLHRVGYGLLLVVAFSIGLACTLTAVGLAFVYARRFVNRSATVIIGGRLARALPVASAFVIACAGAAICYEAMLSAGVNPALVFTRLANLFAVPASGAGSVSTASALAIGLVFGLKHAVEADHIAAVTTIASERKGLLRTSMVGLLWGVGHTFSLLIMGIAALAFHIEISRSVSLALELGVALMLIALGANAIRKLARGGKIHFHRHEHGWRSHLHPHAHDGSLEIDDRSHHGLRLNSRPLFVGMAHGLAGSAALMLLVLSTITSPLLGLVYIAVFGIGSIGGMLAMSAFVSLPVQLTSARFSRANLILRMLAGVFSIGFGIFMAYEISFVDRLFG